MKEYLQGMKKKVKFVSAEFYELNPIILPKEFWDSTGGPFDRVSVECWVVLYNDNGTVGQGPCTVRMREIIKTLLSGETKSYEEWFNTLYWKFRNSGFSSEAAVELGRLDLVLQDMLSKEANLPLHRYLGAKRDWVHVYGSGCGTNLTMQEMEEEVRSYIDAGYSTLKMKVGTNFGTEIDRDVERVKNIRSMIGPKVRLAIDANQLWTADEAMKFIDRVEKYQIAWYEEPVHSHNMTELKKLTARCPVPISMGESIRCYYLMETYVECGVAHLQPVPMNHASIHDWLQTRDLAHTHGLEFSSGGYSHLSASLIATGREEDMVEYLTPIMKTFYNMMDLKPVEADGKFYLPDTPGICVNPDWDLWKKNKYIKVKEYY